MLQFLTRDNSDANKKSRIFFCCHPDEQELFFTAVTSEIFSTHNCAVFYCDKPAREEYEELSEEISRMQLIVVAVSRRLLLSDNYVKELILPTADRLNIPVLPIVREPGLDNIFGRVFGDSQYLDSVSEEKTAISYREKLKNYLDAIIVGDELAEKIRNAFDAYIFLSYRKKDRKYAQELMKLIHSNDFCRDIAIWYDEFLVPGENFNSAIREALEKSPLFALTVTPSLLEEGNYVMDQEYPMAVSCGKRIVPVQFVDTDKAVLESLYGGIPEVIAKSENEKLSGTLLDALKGIALRSNDTPQHDFFIGLAYLSGIDVERNPDIAVKLISSASESGLAEATKKLAQMYYSGEGVKPDADTYIRYQRRLIDQLRLQQEEEPDNDRLSYNYVSSIYELSNHLLSYARYDESISVAKEMVDACDKILASRQSEDILYAKYKILNNIGLTYYNMSRYDESLQYYSRAMEVLDLLESRDAATYKHHKSASRSNIALIHQVFGRYEEALKELLLSNETDREYYDKNPELHGINCVASYNNLGMVYYEIEKFDLSEKSYLEGIEICERHLEVNDEFASMYVVICTNAGDLYTKTRQFELSEVMYKKAETVVTALIEKGISFYENRLSQLYNQLSLLYREQGKYALASEYIGRSIKINEQTYKEEPEVYGMSLADNYNNMALICADYDRFSEALRYYQLAIDIGLDFYKKYPQTYGARLAIYYENMSVSYSKVGDRTNTYKYNLKAIDIHKKLCKENREVFLTGLAASRLNLGNNYASFRNYKKAVVQYKKSIKCYKELVKKNPDAYSMMLAVVRNQLGMSLYHMHKLHKAKKQYEEAIRISDKYGTETDTPSIANFHNNLSLVYSDEGRYVLAERELDVGFKMRQQTQVGNDTVAAQVNDFLFFNNKGNLQVRCGRYEEAEENYHAAFWYIKPLYERNPTAHADNYRIVLENLVELYTVLGRYEEVNMYREELNKM